MMQPRGSGCNSAVIGVGGGKREKLGLWKPGLREWGYEFTSS